MTPRDPTDTQMTRIDTRNLLIFPLTGHPKWLRKFAARISLNGFVVTRSRGAYYRIWFWDNLEDFNIFKICFLDSSQAQDPNHKRSAWQLKHRLTGFAVQVPWPQWPDPRKYNLCISIEGGDHHSLDGQWSPEWVHVNTRNPKKHNLTVISTGEVRDPSRYNLQPAG